MDLTYDISDIFALKVRLLPKKEAVDIARQIDDSFETLPITDGWTKKIGGVCNIAEEPLYFELEYIYQPDESPAYLDINIIEVDDYLDYVIEKKILKSNNNEKIT
jgi:hypothetical protein